MPNIPHFFGSVQDLSAHRLGEYVLSQFLPSKSLIDKMNHFYYSIMLLCCYALRIVCVMSVQSLTRMSYRFYVRGVKGAHMFTWSTVMRLEWGVGLGAQIWRGPLIVQEGQKPDARVKVKEDHLNFRKLLKIPNNNLLCNKKVGKGLVIINTGWVLTGIQLPKHYQRIGISVLKLTFLY